MPSVPPGLGGPGPGDPKYDRFVRRREAARFLGLAPRTLANWACTPAREPGFHRVGRTVLYDLDELRAFASAGRVEAETRHQRTPVCKRPRQVPRDRPVQTAKARENPRECVDPADASDRLSGSGGSAGAAAEQAGPDGVQADDTRARAGLSGTGRPEMADEE